MAEGGRFTRAQLLAGIEPAEHAFLDALFEQAEIGVAIWDRDLRYLRVNESLAAMNGPSAEEHIGRRMRDLLPDLARVLEERLRQVIETGTPAIDVEVSAQTPARPGVIRHWVASYYPLHDAGGDVLGVGAVVVETTQRKDAEERAERREREASFLAEASRVLAASLEYRSTLETIARLAVPAIADWCVVDMLQEDGSIRRVALAHVDAEKEPLAWDLTRRFPSGSRADEGTPKAIRSSNHELVRDVDDAFLKRMASGAEHLEALRSLGWRSLMIVPLIARGRTLGAIALVSAESGRRYDSEDLEFADDLADRCALAVDNARLFSEREQIARALQRSLLPPRMPEIPGVEVAARYRPAGAGEVGGDFYDVAPTADGRWGIAIGDVSGKGPDAAAITALARHTLHVAAAYEKRPSRVLAALNDALLEDVPRPLLTAAYARLSASQPASVEVAIGGHPRPLIVRAEGRVEPAGEPGTILGFAAVPSLHDVTHDLQPGDALVFFTDGVIESRPVARSLGEEGLAELLNVAGGWSAENIAMLIEQAVEERSEGRQADDVALVVLRVLER